MANVIGMAGLLRSGKDTVADHLVEKYGWVKLGMSDPLWDALKALDPYIPVSIDGQRTPVHLGYLEDDLVDEQGLTRAEAYVELKKNPEVRRLLQALGTEVGRDMIGTNTWVDIMVTRVENALADGAPGIVVTGIRFPNELEAVRQALQGEVWWVFRPGIEAPAGTGAHASENSVGVKDADLIIDNSGSLEDLYNLVDEELEDRAADAVETDSDAITLIQNKLW